MAGDDTEDQRLLDRLRAILLRRALAGETVAAGTLAAEAAADPERLPALLETLIREDHAAGRPLLAALAAGEDGNGIGMQRFFDVLRALGRYDGVAQGPEAEAWLALERDDTVAYYRTLREAYVEMIAWLAERMSIFGHPRHEAPPQELVGHEVFHDFQSNMEEMLWILEDSDILEGIPLDTKEQRAREREDDRFRRSVGLPTKSGGSAVKRCRDIFRRILWTLRLTSYYDYIQYSPAGARYRIPRDQFRKQAASVFGGNPSFERVLNCFYDNAVGYGSLPEGRDPQAPFAVPAEFATIMELLSRLGYASRKGDGYFWKGIELPTDLAPYSWTAADIHAHRIQSLISDMPDQVRRRMLSLFPLGVKPIAVIYLYKEDWHLPEAKQAVDILYADWKKTSGSRPV